MERRPRRSYRRRRLFGTFSGTALAHRTRRNAGDGVPYENEHPKVFVLFYFLHTLIAGAICDIMKVNHKEK